MTTAAKVDDTMGNVDPLLIRKNPNNPRRYFNDTSLDLLRTSIQEVGVLVPLIVYRDPDGTTEYVLMDGERRWASTIDLGLDQVPVQVIPAPKPIDNLLQMFNIHAVREDWPLVSIALSLREVMKLSGEDRETRLAEWTGLTRSTVRRAKRLLSLPDRELELIQAEAHLDRAQQTHREDLYLEIEAAVSVIRNRLPELANSYHHEEMIRAFARKRENGSLTAVTEFRLISRLFDAMNAGALSRETVLMGIDRLFADEYFTPRELFEHSGSGPYELQSIGRRAELLAETLRKLEVDSELSDQVRDGLAQLRAAIDRLLVAR